MFDPFNMFDPFGAGRRRTPTLASLFGPSDVGGIWDASVLTSLFQDSAGTTPVTAAGQPVGKMLDLSGKGNHYTQSVSASRPTYQVDGAGRPYLAFDGVDDGMLTGTITPAGGADKAQVFAGRRYAATQNMLGVGYGPIAASGGLYDYYRGVNAATQQNVMGYGLGGTNEIWENNGSAVSPRTLVTSVLYDRALAAAIDEMTPRINGAVTPKMQNAGANTPATGAFTAQILYCGRTSTNAMPFSGNMYAHIVRIAATNLTPDQIAAAEAWVNQRTGAY